MEYLKGIIYVIIYLVIPFLVGTAYTKQKSAPSRTIAGYIIYTIITGIVGIVVQMFKFNWNIYYWFVIILDILLIGSSIYFIKKKEIDIFEGSFKNFIKRYWFLIFVSVIAITMVTFQNAQLWSNNESDDSYYLNKIATLPYETDSFNINVRTGLHATSPMFGMRIFNTFELESSVYCYFFKMIPTLFARCFLSFNHYFILVCTLYTFAEKIFEKAGKSVNKNTLQYIGVVLVMYCFDTNVLATNGILELRDGWMIHTGMFFGSLVVKTCGFIWLLLPLLNEKRSYLMKAIQFGLILFALVNKSTTVLPIAAVVLMSYGLKELYFKDKKYFMTALFIIMFIGVFVKNDGARFLPKFESEGGTWDYFADNMASIVIVPFICSIIWLTYKYRNIKFIKNLSMMFLGFFVLCGLDPFNNIFELVSNYSFVVGRTNASLTMLIVAYGSTLLGFEYANRKHSAVRFRPVLFAFIAVILSCTSIYAKEGSLHNIKREMRTFYHNRYFVTTEVKELGEALNVMNKEKGEIIAFVPERLPTSMDTRIVVGKHRNYLLDMQVAGAVRQFAPNVISVVPRWRFGETDDPRFKNYDDKAEKTYVKFFWNPTEDTYKAFSKEIKKWPVNTIITFKPACNTYIERMGYKCYKKIDGVYKDFCIYYKSN